MTGGSFYPGGHSTLRHRCAPPTGEALGSTVVTSLSSVMMIISESVVLPPLDPSPSPLPTSVVMSMETPVGDKLSSMTPTESCTKLAVEITTAAAEDVLNRCHSIFCRQDILSRGRNILGYFVAATKYPRTFCRWPG